MLAAALSCGPPDPRVVEFRVVCDPNSSGGFVCSGSANDRPPPADAAPVVPPDSAVVSGDASQPDASPPDAGAPDAATPAPPATGDCSAGEHDYVVGPGEEFGSLAAVPWAVLPPGSTVRVRWRPEPYRERVLISTSGVTLCGLRGPLGQRPVIDADAAAVNQSVNLYRKPEHANLGLVMTYASSRQAWNDRPSDVTIAGIELRGAYSGTPGGWGDGSACVRIQDGGKRISILDCWIHDCDNGIFASSTGTGPHLAEGIRVLGNTFDNNGARPGARNRSHHTYIQAVRTVYDGNTYGAVRAGSGATAIKDRGPGTIVRRNRISGGSVAIDLVEAQDFYDAVASYPDYGTAYVIDNVIETADIYRAIHFGGDVLAPSQFRHGPLYVVHNTFSFRDSADQWSSAILGLDTAATVALVANNLVTRTGGRVGGPGVTLLTELGTVSLGTNAIVGPWAITKHGAGAATVTGLGNVTADPNAAPGPLPFGSPASTSTKLGAP